MHRRIGIGISTVLSAFTVFVATSAAPLRAEWLFMAGSNTIQQYESRAGVLTFVGSRSIIPGWTTFPENELALDARHNVLYTTNWNGRRTVISAFGVGQDGTLTPIESIDSTVHIPDGAIVDPAGRFLYLGDANVQASIQAYAIGPTGRLTAVGLPTPIPSVPRMQDSFVMDPHGKFLFFVASNCNCILTFGIGSTGELTPAASPVYTSPGIFGASIDAAGKYLYVAGFQMLVYRIAADGSLTLAASYPTDLSVSRITVDPMGKFAYAGGFTIQEYSVGSDGTLTSIGSAAPHGCCMPGPLLMDRTGRILYAIYSGDLVAYSVDSSGALTLVSAAGLMPNNEVGNPVIVNGCNEPPRIDGAAAKPSLLWPADRRLSPVDVNYDVSASCGIPVCELHVSSNEPAQHGQQDWVVVGPHSVLLRADRDGGGTGRIYTIGIACLDTNGNTNASAVSVLVPHDRGR